MGDHSECLATKSLPHSTCSKPTVLSPYKQLMAIVVRLRINTQEKKVSKKCIPMKNVVIFSSKKKSIKISLYKINVYPNNNKCGLKKFN